MKNLKTLVVLYLGFLGIVIGSVFADNLQVSTTSQIMTTCNGGTFPIIYYAGASAITATDTFKSNSALIWRFLADSSVSVYNPYNLVNFPSPLSTAFPFYSNGKPPTVNSVVITATPITISSTIPSGYQSRNTIAAQLVYTIKRYERGYAAGNNFSITYLVEGGSSSQTFYYNNASPVFDAVWDNECRNIYVGFCGDGIVDNTDQKSATITGGSYTSQQLQQMLATKLAGGEECDLGANNGKSGYNCSANCKIIPQPTCSSSYSGQILDNLTSSNTLCTSPFTISNFATGADGLSWTRKCNNTAGQQLQCSAKRNPQCGSNYNGQQLTGDITSTTAGLCNPGSVSNFTTASATNNRTWTRKCDGQAGTTQKSCTAYKKINGACSSSYNGITTGSLESGNHLCNAGTVTGFVFNTTNQKWTWGCQGINGGTNTTCSANKLPSPTCNSNFSGQVLDALTSNDTLCNSPFTISNFATGADGLSWTRKCNNTAGQGVQCSAKRNPQCGSNYNGQQLTGDIASTTAGLCNPGSVSNFTTASATNNRTWTRKCDGQAGTTQKSCTAYKKINGACSSSYNGITTGSLESGNHLCNAGTVTGFVFNTTNQKWTWGCQGINGGTNITTCSANKLGQAVIEKTLITTNPVIATGQEVKWKITVLASGGSIKDFQIKDTLPIELAHVTSKVLFSGGTVITGPNQSGQVLTWQIAGTLSQGQKIEIELTTEVVKMPTGNVKNVACVIYNGLEKCDDEELGGKLIIKKELLTTGTVITSGDSVKRRLTVTASGGSIKDFQIKDILPTELSYGTSNVVFVPNGVTVSMPLLISGQVVVWQVSGTLSQNQSVVIELTTKVVKQPVGDVKNVACVVYYGVEDCDEVTITLGEAVMKKELLTSGVVLSSGSEVKWRLTVTASGGDISNFPITDKLPAELNYVSSAVTGTLPGLTILGPTFTGNNKLLTWIGSGTLPQGKSVVIEIITKLNVDPAGKDIWNEACVVYNGAQHCDIIPLDGSQLWIKKTFMDGTKGLKTYASGDLVGYKIAFGNSGSAVAAMVSIKDYLPQNLNYVSSQLYINSSYSTGQYLSGGAFVDAYSGITLPSGGSGYLLLTGRVTSAYSDQTTNFVYIYLNNQFIAYDDVAYTFTPPNKHLKITKTVDNSDVNVGDEVTFILRVLNDGEVPMTGFDVLDTFPTDDFTFISQNSSGFTFERKGRMFSWGNYQGVLQPKDFIEIKFTIKLTKVGEYTNWACMTHEDFPDWKSDRQNRENCDPADVNVREKLFCKMTSPSNDSVYYVDGNNKAKVKITCGSSNGASATIKINCGNGTIFEKKNVSTYSEFCEYSVGTRGPSCFVNGKSEAIGGGVCKTTIFVEKNNIREPGYCGDGVINDWKEDCECDDGSKNCLLRNADSVVRVNNYDEVRCVECRIVKENTIQPVACFNVNNGSISINQGEMLPFYWNIEKIQRNLHGTTNDDDCVHGSIALNTMRCTFHVYNGESTDSGGKPVYEIVTPCFTKGLGPDSDRESPLIQSFVGYNAFDTLNDTDGNVFFRSSRFIIDNFGNSNAGNWIKENWGSWKINNLKPAYGEYKLSLESVEYEQCVEGGWQRQKSYDRVCQVDFTVTNDYILQKTPSGTIRDNGVNLGKYFMYPSGRLWDYTQLSNILAETASNSQDEGGKIKDAMKKFIDKYSKLAIKADPSENCFTLSKRSDSIQKVPGKEIYLVKTDITIKGNTSCTKPFTIVQTDGNIIIEGSITPNMMLLTTGTITFDAGSFGKCHETQTIKGILYAKEFKSTGVERNTNLANPKRCIGGNLHIKGIAIGKGLDTVMKGRRSNLNNRFTAKGDEKEIVSTRRNYVMNGASVLVEYAPSVFVTSTMPPGAEEFMTALEVYRR